MEVIKAKKDTKIALLLELDQLVRENGSKTRISELRKKLKLREKEIKKPSYYNRYLKMKSMDFNDAEIIFLMGINYSKLDDLKREYAIELEDEANKYQDHVITKRYKKRISRVYFNGK